MWIRKYLREDDYLHINQNIHRLYLNETYLGNGLISVRDMQLMTIVKLYREIKHKEENDIYKRIDNIINNKYKSKSMLNKIYIHQKYLKCSGLYNIIQQNENDEEVYQYVNSKILSYHVKGFQKDYTSQAMDLINHLRSYLIKNKIMGRIWKKYLLINTMFRLITMVLENAFLPLFKKMLFIKG